MKYEEVLNIEPKVGMAYENIGNEAVVTEVINSKKIAVTDIFGKSFLLSKRKDGLWYKVGEPTYQFGGFLAKVEDDK